MRLIAKTVVALGFVAAAAACGGDDDGGGSGGLTAPTGLKITTVDGKPHLTWTDAMNEESYMIERMDHSVSTTEWALVRGAENLVPNTVQYHDGTAEAGKTYMYRVMAMKGEEEALSNEVAWP